MSSDPIVEKVPKFRRRMGDKVTEGSNNTIIILGTDRAKKGPATVGDGLGFLDASGNGVGTGTIHIIAGRKEDDPDLDKDDSFIYITMKSKVDDNLGIAGVEAASNDMPGAIIKSDLVRIIGRKNIKICVNDDEKHYAFMDGQKFKINFNTNATIEIVDKKITIKMGDNEFMMDGDKVKIKSPKVQLTGGCEAPWDDFFESVLTHNHLGPSGPVGPAKTGPSSAKLVSDKSAWDQKVKN